MMKYSIKLKAVTAGVRVSDNLTNYDDKNHGFKYFIEQQNTHRVLGRFHTQKEMESALDDLIEQAQEQEEEQKSLDAQFNEFYSIDLNNLWGGA